MKVILTGATGVVGGAALKQLIADDRVTSIVALTRRDLNEEAKASPKVDVIIHEDFSVYHQPLMDRIKDAEACIWCVGGKATDFPDLETAHKVQVNFALAAANALAETATPIRFVFCSALFAARDEDQSLWFMKDTRRLKGEAENGLIEVGKANEGFEAFVMRPGGILPADSYGLTSLFGPLLRLVKVDQLAKVMVEIALNGYKEQTLENAAIARFKF